MDFEDAQQFEEEADIIEPPPIGPEGPDFFRNGADLPDGDPLLSPGTAQKGYRHWTEGALPIDPRHQEMPNIINHMAHVIWHPVMAHVEVHQPYDFFCRLFPMSFMINIALHANDEIERKNLRIREIEVWEVQTYLGIRIAIGLDRSRGSLQELFSSYQALIDSIRNRCRREINPINGEFMTINFEKRVIRPVIVENVFSVFSAIDVNDHIRQGILELERYWLTNSWWVRILTTLIGTSVSGAFLASVNERRQNHHIHHAAPQLDLINFAGKVAYSMIFNPLRPANVPRPVRQRANNGVVAPVANTVRVN